MLLVDEEGGPSSKMAVTSVPASAAEWWQVWPLTQFHSVDFSQSRISVRESLLLDRRSIDLSGEQEKEVYFHYENFLRAS